MAPVVVELGAEAGLVVPLIAVHLFVFYFGIMADVTPPVGLASFAAAAISGGDPIRTGITAFWYSLRTAALPFLFIFNTQLLLIGIEGPFHLVLTVLSATLGMLVFAAATMNHFLTRSRIWESALLLLIAFSLFRPGFWMDMIYPPYEEIEPARIAEVAGRQPEGARLRLEVTGATLEGRDVSKIVLLPLGPAGEGEARLEEAGLELLTEDDGRVLIDNVVFGSPAEGLGLEWDWEITGVYLPVDRPAKEWMFIPALILLGVVVLLQRRRMRPGASAAGAAEREAFGKG
jgi:Domain of unknown function (DUF3394)/Tripartite ATP-independent periplasmic transporter, DctM component